MSFSKTEYWKNREAGKRGQGKLKKSTTANDTATMGFDNSGSVVVMNRAYRRQRTKLAVLKKIVKRKKTPKLNWLKKRSKK